MNGKMEPATKQKRRGSGRSVVGHHWAICGLLSRLGVKFRCFPIATQLISGQKRPFEFVVNSKGEANSIGFFQSVLALIQQVSQTIDVSR